MSDYLTLLKTFSPGDAREAADKALILDCCHRYGEKILTREALAAHITSSAFVMSPDLGWVLMAWHNIYKSWAWTGGLGCWCARDSGYPCWREYSDR